jgi:hypothetical protein
MAESKKPDLLKTPVVVSHLIAYVIFNLISFLVDYFIPMSVKWYYWTIFGWGIFILLHIFASALFGVLNLSFSSGLLLAHTLAYVSVGALLILMDTFSGTGFSDPITNFSIYPIVFWSVIYVGHFLVIIYWNSESIRKQMAESTKPFHLKGPMVAFHFITYVVFNIIAYLSVTFILKGELWYYWTIFGWGIFVLLHALSSAIYGAFNLTVSSGLLLAHTIAFVSVSSLLILINAYSGTGFTDPITWALFPVVFWAVFYILHFIVYIIWLRRPTQADVEKEVERLRSQKK